MLLGLFLLSTGHTILIREQAVFIYMWLEWEKGMYLTELSETSGSTALFEHPNNLWGVLSHCKDICGSVWLASAGFGDAHPCLLLVL